MVYFYSVCYLDDIDNEEKTVRGIVVAEKYSYAMSKLAGYYGENNIISCSIRYHSDNELIECVCDMTTSFSN